MHNRLALIALVALLGVGTVVAQETPRYTFKQPHPDGIGKVYHGREIAHVMGFQAAGWLDRPEREKEEHCSKLLKALEIKPGQVIADVGAGSGFYTLPMAEQAGEKGKVYAVDIQKQMLDIIQAKMKKQGVANIECILGTEKEPKLPKGQVDLILLVDVYHEFSFPHEMTQGMVDALKVGGRIAFVEYRLEDPRVPIKLLHKMSQRQVLKEMTDFPLKHVKTIDTLPWQHIILMEKVEPRESPKEGK